MKALTVQQPWAWAIFHGKTIENRTQLWKYRGPLAIHAGLQWAANGERHDRVRAAVADHVVRQDEDLAREWFRTKRMPREFMGFGAIVGTVDLVDVHESSIDCYRNRDCYQWGEFTFDLPRDGTGRFAERRRIVHLVLENPRDLAEPIACRGALGLWTPPNDVLDRLNRALNVPTEVHG